MEDLIQDTYQETESKRKLDQLNFMTFKLGMRQDLEQNLLNLRGSHNFSKNRKLKFRGDRSNTTMSKSINNGLEQVGKSRNGVQNVDAGSRTQESKFNELTFNHTKSGTHTTIQQINRPQKRQRNKASLAGGGKFQQAMSRNTIQSNNLPSRQINSSQLRRNMAKVISPSNNLVLLSNEDQSEAQNFKNYQLVTSQTIVTQGDDLRLDIC